MQHNLIIVFDGVCNFCEFWVNFVIKRDKMGKFKFAPAQSQAGKKIQNEYGIDVLDLETMILLKNGVLYKKSDATSEIAKHLDGLWKVLSCIKIVPRTMRDWVYSKIAENRYRWFGRKESCMVPTADVKARFLE